MKTIDRTSRTPKWANYVATDCDGASHYYPTKFIAQDSIEWGFPISARDVRFEPADIKPYCEDWRLSLRKLK